LKITSVRVKNYKSYRDSGLLKLYTGFNLITGQNNAGKTALLEAISLTFENRPHRSSFTMPVPESVIDAQSSVDICMEVEGAEFNDTVLIPGASFQIPAPVHGTSINSVTQFTHPNVSTMTEVLEWILSRDIVHLKMTIKPGHAVHHDIPSFGLYPTTLPSAGAIQYAQFEVDMEKRPICRGLSNLSGAVHADVGTFCFQTLRGRIYYFKAERYNLGACETGSSTILRPDASNLAEVLANLQSNQSRFRRYNEIVKFVLPQVKQVSAHNISSNRVEARIWLEDPANEREDLAFPIHEAGTGVGQVLAILYVVMNSNVPRTILIDEPQSFLHPGAARKLIDVLKQYPHHQYILTTHSPTIISSTNPSTLTLIKQEDVISTLHPLDTDQNEHLREYLSEIGASLADVFGADNVLWVEGATEEICFPLILKARGTSLMGTSIVGVKSTGDLQGKNRKEAQTIFDIYSKLSTGTGLIPPAIGFIFDRDELTNSEQTDIKRSSRDAVVFLKRRLYENYLLNVDSICAVAKEIWDANKNIAEFRASPVTTNEIEEWLEAHKNEAKYYTREHPYSEESWQENVHGATLLSDLFNAIFEGKVPYRKTEHSVALTKRIITDKLECFDEIGQLIEEHL
jgi:energy-coupling factor transporter ATP-binding protein EcfA2